MSTGGRPPSCVPTWHGHIETTKDALIVFEACFQGTLHHCSRRPHDRERNQLIVSGNVFVYEEATSGIKRWTDGIPWSPSRILTNFLIYRQLNSPFPPGEKKRATKRSQRPSRPGEPYSTPTSTSNTPATNTPATNTPVIDDHKPFSPESPKTPSFKKEEESPDKDANRGLVGSLVDSYEFKENGLLKKTMTVTVRNVQHHLVSYYSLDDAKYKLKTPRDDDRLKDIPISEALLKQPKFKFPNLDDAGDGSFESLDGGQSQYAGYYNPIDQARAYATAHHPYPYSSSISYPHPGAYAPSHPPPAVTGYATMPPTNSLYAPMASPGQYAQQHSHYQQYYQAQAQAQAQSHYHPGYAQHYQTHQTPVQAQQVHTTPIKQERATTQYNYGAAHQNAAVGHMYGSHGTPGTAPPQPESVLPATTQPQQAQTWPINSNYHSAWGGRPESSAYSQYRSTS
ncbi:MAG: hypothetical protein Q9164_003960 [Protoblastenia rupestris]